MLPLFVKENVNVNKYYVLPENTIELAYATEYWERKSDKRDVPTVYSFNYHIPGKYYGEWVDKTELHKAKLELYEAEQAIIKEEEREHKRKLLAEKAAKNAVILSRLP